MSKSIITLLKEQHDETRKTLEALSKTTERGLKIRSELLVKLERDLSHHMTLEEELFYPCFKGAVERKKDKKIFYEAKEEHHAAEKVLRDLSHTEIGSLAFGGKAKVLRELVEHHMNEEEKEMFPLAKEMMSQEELTELGEKLIQRQGELEGGLAWDRTNVAEYTHRVGE
jgi:iron-sulfur cluster repair protein YtfE (RIC family)